MVAISPDGASLASAGADHIVRLHSVATGEPIGEDMRHAYYVLGVAFTPDRRFLATSCLDGSVRLWDAQTGRLCRKWSAREGVQPSALAIHPDGRFLIAVYGDKTLRRWPLPQRLPDDANAITAHVEKTTRLRWVADKNRFRTMTAAEWNALEPQTSPRPDQAHER